MTLLPSTQNARRIARFVALAASTTALGMAVACGPDTVSAPKSSASQFTAAQLKLADKFKNIGTPLTPAIALERTTALVNPVVQSALIGRNGGTIEMKDLGLKVSIPSGAIIGNPITITVTAVAGKQVAYEFQPHGTIFLRPLKFEQATDNTTWDDLKFKGTLLGGYFQSLDQLNLFGLGALLNETYPVSVDKDKISFDIWHFSGYMVSTGRADDDGSQF